MTNPQGTKTKPPTLITTPAEASHCSTCDATGIRYPFDRLTFPHCPVCGSTDLEDWRSPWEVLHEARNNAAAPGLSPELRIGRLDVVAVVEAIADASTCECMDCTYWARRAR